ncbi:MAG: hypothetical protein AAFX58_02245 [Pseudomonadota bacterium]
MSERDEELLQRLRDSVDERVAAQDAATRSRLNRARQRALGELGRRRRVTVAGPLVGAAAALALAVVIWQRPDTAAGLAPPAGEGLEFEWLLAGDSVEMIEDYEFYALVDALELVENSG